MRYLIWAGIGLGLILLAFVGVARADGGQLICVAESDAAQVAKAAGQHAVATGALSVGGAVLVTADDAGAWTLWIAPKPGILCPLMLGAGWRDAKPETPS